MSFRSASPAGKESTASPVDVEGEVRRWLADPNYLLEDGAPQASVVPVSRIPCERDFETSELGLTCMAE